MPAGDPSSLAADLAALATRLRAAGEGGLTEELRNRIGDAVQPVADQIRRSLAPHMPNRYAATLDPDLGLTTYRQLIPGEAKVTLRAYSRGTKKRKLRRLNAGVLSHPLFGNREHWYSQGPAGGGMVPGFFDDPVRAAGPRVREAVLGAVRDISERIMGR